MKKPKQSNQQVVSRIEELKQDEFTFLVMKNILEIFRFPHIFVEFAIDRNILSQEFMSFERSYDCRESFIKEVKDNYQYTMYLLEIVDEFLDMIGYVERRYYLIKESYLFPLSKSTLIRLKNLLLQKRLKNDIGTGKIDFQSGKNDAFILRLESSEFEQKREILDNSILDEFQVMINVFYECNSSNSFGGELKERVSFLKSLVGENFNESINGKNESLMDEKVYNLDKVKFLELNEQNRTLEFTSGKFVFSNQYKSIDIVRNLLDFSKKNKEYIQVGDYIYEYLGSDIINSRQSTSLKKQIDRLNKALIDQGILSSSQNFIEIKKVSGAYSIRINPYLLDT